MDSIRQYQRLSLIKPSYQKLTLPYYSVSKFKIQHNIDELDLHYKGLGWWEPEADKQSNKNQKSKPHEPKKSKRGGSIPDARNKVVLMSIELDPDHQM